MYINLAQLTTEQRIVYDRIKNLQGNSIYHAAIRNALQHADTDGFVHLVQELKHIALETPDRLRGVVGASAFNAIMNLETSKREAA